MQFAKERKKICERWNDSRTDFVVLIGEETQKVGSEDANEIVCALPDVLFDSFVFQDLYDIEYDIVYELSDGLGKIVVVI